MKSNDQKKLEALYENIGLSSSISQPEVPSAETSNPETPEVSTKEKVKGLLSDTSLGLSDEISDEHLDQLLKQYGLSDEVEEDPEAETAAEHDSLYDDSEV